jgi:hypothetical protein
MYYKLSYGAFGRSEKFEARSDKEAIAKAKRKLQRDEKNEEIEITNPKLYYYGPGGYEVWTGEMWFDGDPTYDQYHEVDVKL